MLRDVRKARLGWRIWKRMLKQFWIDYDTAMLVLPEKDEAWNECALRYFPDYVRRKCANRSFILVRDRKTAEKVKSIAIGIENCEVLFLPRYKMDLLLKYYCLHKFFDNIVMMYMDEPRDNDTRRILQQGIVSMSEVICLCFYQLREVPKHV